MTPATKPTSRQIATYLDAIRAIADAVRDAREIPSGTVYAACGGNLTLDVYEGIIRRLVGAELITMRGYMLVWVGPTLEDAAIGERT